MTKVFPLLAPPRLPRRAHKGRAGRVLLVAGSTAMPGAAILGARAAQRAGAGLVQVACLEPGLVSLLPVTAPEAILIDATGVVAPGRDFWSLREPHAVVLGPGLGDTPRTRALVDSALEHIEVPLILDADGLNVLAGEPELLRRARGPVVLTPHPLEAARLLGEEVPPGRDGRRKAALELAQRSGAFVVLKGHESVLSDGEGTQENTSGSAALATAGAGDVLSGILGAYLAQTLSLQVESWTVRAALASAVHVHGLCGDHASELRGERAVIASDLVEALGHVQKKFTGRGDPW